MFKSCGDIWHVKIHIVASVTAGSHVHRWPYFKWSSTFQVQHPLRAGEKMNYSSLPRGCQVINSHLKPALPVLGQIQCQWQSCEMSSLSTHPSLETNLLCPITSWLTWVIRLRPQWRLDPSLDRCSGMGGGGVVRMPPSPSADLSLPAGVWERVSRLIGPGDWTHCGINYTLSYHWA